MKRALGAALSLALLLSIGCAGDGDGEGGDSGDLPYHCSRWTAAWCAAYLDCDRIGFGTAFRDLNECLIFVEEDCLDPPAGHDRCSGATALETDSCVEYLESNHPEGCANLFGVRADMSPCEAICD